MKLKMIPLTQDLVDQLEALYGNHSEVARRLGFGTRYYRRIRNTMVASARTVMQMRFLVENPQMDSSKPLRRYQRRTIDQAING